MNQKVAITILLAVVMFSVCFTTSTSTPIPFPSFSGTSHISNLQQLPAAFSIVVGANVHNNNAQPLDQPTRLEIYNCIKDNPGVHFRGICGKLGLSVGIIQYHLSVLEHVGLITSYNDGQNKRYFERSAVTKTDVKLISLMRHNTTAQILTALAKNPSVLHRDLAKCLGISSQALTWHMNQIKKAGLISAEKVGVNVKYCFSDADARKLILKLASATRVENFLFSHSKTAIYR